MKSVWGNNLKLNHHLSTINRDLTWKNKNELFPTALRKPLKHLISKLCLYNAGQFPTYAYVLCLRSALFIL